MYQPDIRAQFDEISASIAHQDCYRGMGNQLYALLGNVLGRDMERRQHEHFMPFGALALAPEAAACCVNDNLRTYKLVRGLYLAIRKVLSSTDRRPIKVLDVGCGPFAILTSLVASMFKPGEVEFHALDIHSISIECCQKVLDVLGLKEYYGSFICADATQYHPEMKFDVIIAEVMRSLLQHEPQIAVTANMRDALTPEGIFLPEDIRIFAEIGEEGKEGRLLGDIFTLNKDTIFPFRKNGVIDRDELRLFHKVRKTFRPDPPIAPHEEVAVKTRVRVFEDVILEPDESHDVTSTNRMRAGDRIFMNSVHVKFQMGDGDSETGARIFIS